MNVSTSTEKLSVTPASVTQNICDECHLPFEAKRHDAKCCSQNCRKRRSRRKANMHREMLKAFNHINDIKYTMDKHPELVEFGLECLSKIASKVSVTVAVVTDKSSLDNYPVGEFE